MTRAELQAAVAAVLDDVVTAEPRQFDPGWEDTIMRATDAYATDTAAASLRAAAEFFGFADVNLDKLVVKP